MRRMEMSHLISSNSIYNERRKAWKRSGGLTGWAKNFQFHAKKIDVFSRFGFPLVFFLFNLWYWSYYLTRVQGSKAD